MDIAKLNPWNWFKKEDEQEKALPVKRRDTQEYAANHPLLSLHNEIDRIFDATLRDFGMQRWPLRETEGPSLFKPKVDIAGSDKEYSITAELPGIEEKDITLELQGDALVIKAEKRQETKKEDKGYYRVERSYGSFQRVLAVPEDADTEQIKAKYDKGVLHVTLPRKETVESSAKRIAIE